ncbi:Uncharacterised protein [Mycobacterium tuberculosis]|nr:Uncharacterised protein [Mycobacterium tuberculosis]
MQYDWESWKSFCQFLQVVKVKTFPVCWVRTMDVTDTSCQEVNTSFNHCFSVFDWSQFTFTDNSVFFTTDSTNFSFY